MDYSIRKNILPTFFQIGYPALHNGVFVGESTMLATQNIESLHYHHCIELGICCSGSGDAHVENRIYRFQAGDIQFVGSNVPHFSTADPDVHCVWIWIFVDTAKLFLNDGSHLAESVLKLGDNSFNGIFHPSEYPNLADLVYKLRDLGNKNTPFNDLDHLFLAGQLMVEAAKIGDVDQSSKLNISNRLKPALTYIRNHYMDSNMVSEEQIAESCNLSVSHFRALFREDIGITLPKYLLKTRLSSVVYLLQNTDRKIEEIALESGFSDSSYFNRLFKKEYGITPKEMRKRSRAPALMPVE